PARSWLGSTSTRASWTRSGRSPSCPGRPFIAGCARSSAAWPADALSACASASVVAVGRSGARSHGRPVAVHRRDELVELVAGEAPLAAGRPVAADVARVGPAADCCERHAQVARRLRAREDELAGVAWEHCAGGHEWPRGCFLVVSACPPAPAGGLVG